MSRVKSFFAQVMDHPVLRVVLALALLVTSTGSMALAAYADDYINGGVTWGAGAPAVPLADVNPMGVNLFLEKEVEQEKVVKTLDMVRDGGYKWVRQGFAWNDIEISGKGIYTDTRNPGKVVNSWDKYDFIVDKAQENGLQIMARLDSPPLWARMPGDDVEQFHKGPPANNQDFGDFARAVAERYKGKIKYYQIWNEPNLWGEWGGHAINAEEYVELLKVAHDSIKSVDPDAVIVTAALAPTTDVSLRNLNDILFLEDMYKAGAAPYFDVFSTMLYGLGQSPEDRRADLDRLSFSRPILLREVMERNGDADKAIWISEYSWLSLPPDLMGDTELSRPPWEGGKNIWGDVVDEQTQARYLVEGYERARSEWPWMGPMFVWHFRNPDGDPREPATYFSIVNQDFTPRPAYEALKDYSSRVPTTPVTQDKPLWNVVVFPLLYIITGAFALAAAAFSVSGVGRWASIALNRPVGRYPELLRTIGRDTAAVAGMALLFGLYYGSGNLPLLGAALAGYWAIAVLKPSAALALVAFSIPFFWYPKQYGSQHFPIAETLLLLAFAAVATRAFLRNFLPGVAARLHMVNGGEPVPSAAATWPSISGNGNGTGPWRATETAESPVSLEDPRATRPLPITPREDSTGGGEADVLRPARWPARPTVALVTPAEGLRTTDERAAAVNGRPGTGHALPQADENPSSVVVRPSSGAGTAASAWSRFVAWNRQDAFAAPAVILLILGALSLLTLADPTFAPDSARAYRWMIIEPVLLYFLMTDVLKSRRGLLRMLDFFVAGAVLVALYGLFQYVTHNGVLVVEGVSRIPSVYQHPNNLALYLGRVVPFVVCAALFLPGGPRKALYALAALPLGAAFLLTFSRGAWVGAAAAVVLAVSLGLRWPSGWTTPRLPRAFKLWLGGVAASAVVLAVLVAVLFPRLPERVFSFGSGFTRFTIWESALRMAVDHPLTGVGPDQFLNQFRAQYGPEQCRDQNAVPPPGSAGEGSFAECYTSHPHNIFLDYWLSLGIMGLFALVWLVWRYYREAILLAKWAASRAAADPVVRALAIGLVAIVTDFLVHGLVDNSYFLMDLALIFWMSCGVVQLLRVESRRSLVEPAAPQ